MLLANLRVLSDYYKKIDATKEIIAHLFINLVTRKMKQLSFTSNKAVQGTNVHNGFQAKIIA